jgi:OOP family OmpA-OmpF porin
MSSQRILVGLVTALVVVLANGQTNAPRWRDGTGLQPGQTDFRVACGTVAFPCDGAATLPLYSSDKLPHSLAMQIGTRDRAAALRVGAPQGLKVSLIGRAAVGPDVGVYGRLGMTTGRSSTLAAGAGSEAGTSYGVGLSWDLSRSASATVGWDTYDVRTAIGDSRDVRATSLGLQWRY